jgi:Eco57I restriction-modification methylase
VSRKRATTFTTIRTEGGLLSRELLARVASGDATLPGLRAEDYHLARGERVGEMVTRSWNRLTAAWKGFAEALAALPESEATSTSLTRERWLLVLFAELGYGRLQPTRAVEVDGKTYPLSHQWGLAPIHLVGARVDLDHRTPGVPGAAGTSPHALVQELLNRSDERLWGMVSNGRRLRLLRDNASLTRQAFIEFDLETMLADDVFDDFVALWLLCHESRVEGDPGSCWLERWTIESAAAGIRALDTLRDGVEAAVTALGGGFVSHAANGALRQALRAGLLTPEDYYRQLLRTVYRLLFLFVAEDRNLLFRPDASGPARRRYTEHYSLDRIRTLAARRRGGAHPDLWQGLRIVLGGLGRPDGLPALGLPQLGSLLWSPAATPDLDTAELANRDLLEAVRALAFTRDLEHQVDYRNLGSEELGSVYESLLELQPRTNVDAGTFQLAVAGGHERKTTGSFYTHSALIVALLDLALDPLLDEAAAAPDPERAILDLKVLDPACGSGHFLVAAAHRIARRLATHRTGEDEPSPDATRTALRDVIGRCVYGIDRNPMAVELCKVSLWMEALEPGRPLSFLDHHVVCGDAILGATAALLSRPVPEAAFTAVFDDDKKRAASLRAQNRQEASGQGVLDLDEPSSVAADLLAAAAAAIESVGDDTAEQVAEKERRFAELASSADARRAQLVTDAWCVAFLAPKRPGRPAVTQDVVRRLNDGGSAPPQEVIEAIKRTATHYRLLHPHLAFPTVLGSAAEPGSTDADRTAGFDLVIGNPPWDTLSPDRKEFFSAYDPRVRFAKKADQDALVVELLGVPEIARRWDQYQRDLYVSVHFMKNSGRYRLFAPGNLGKGDFNIYRMFVEASMQLARPGGFIAQVLPAGFYGGANAMAIRKELYEHWDLRTVLGFINTTGVWFPGVHRDTSFCSYAARKGGATKAFDVAFELRDPADLTRAMDGGAVRLSVDAVRDQSPKALAIPELTSAGDAALVDRMYTRWPKFGDEAAGSPIRHYMTEIHMGNDRELFGAYDDGLPLYEGRMIDQFDHRAKAWRSGRGRAAVWEALPFGDLRKAIIPQWRVPRRNVPVKLGDRVDRYRIGFGDVTGPRNERSLIATLIPRDVICGHKVPTIVFPTGWEWAYMPWLAVANSFCIDFLVRKKVALSVSYTLLDSMPFPRLPIDHPVVVRLGPLALRLTCTALEMAAYWNAMASHGWCEPIPEGMTPPGFVDEASRAAARAEIDAVVARDLFGLTADELAGILDTFAALRRREERAYGEYRTKRLILECYEAMRLPQAPQ